MEVRCVEDIDGLIQHKNYEEEKFVDDIDVILMQKKWSLFLKRGLDMVLSVLGLTLLIPLFIVVAASIKIDSPGPIFYKQTRVGKNGKPFEIYKFRKMRNDLKRQGINLTTSNDSRLTKIGSFLRKSKIDELPQVINVLKGDMSIVGPRPETPNFVDLYTANERKILKIKPGITDYASIYYINEGELLEKAHDPERYYIDHIMPAKIKMNVRYINDISTGTDVKIVLLTFVHIFKSLKGGRAA